MEAVPLYSSDGGGGVEPEVSHPAGGLKPKVRGLSTVPLQPFLLQPASTRITTHAAILKFRRFLGVCSCQNPSLRIS